MHAGAAFDVFLLSPKEAVFFMWDFFVPHLWCCLRLCACALVPVFVFLSACLIIQNVFCARLNSPVIYFGSSLAAAFE